MAHTRRARRIYQVPISQVIDGVRTIVALAGEGVCSSKYGVYSLAGGGE